ncbi:helix-turn-helix transcriptional regulator [Nitratidesulfovibrio vulgaris]|jgi:excisionase family DNA binding protein|uniref:DNA-binding domain, excisionase family n=1 Tax=Nitratidesulfovibrio vulgaris (strain ATCC 29579 / DSM 644 / CCUG 34227 / NCIMB 8303 / VKM B-1760 / Hildenborough) TaxID=882 RepID=Q727I0_NITV2|nr:helix-turn-helix domain-containing protein [Nitratidesulfovibrio vulgaris]AAS97347.1 DNA-binding domain, excisionase family [Nitratidesulfovibrio vulgaris str. Hildenborough]ADP87798.1 DNA binding domain protein, excisionase family [Nitratidesulfovibrio vulgaris RCH1]
MNSGNDLGRKLNWRQACTLLGCSQSHFYNLVNSGEIPSYRHGVVRGVRVLEQDCLNYLARRQDERELRQNHV